MDLKSTVARRFLLAGFLMWAGPVPAAEFLSVDEFLRLGFDQRPVLKTLWLSDAQKQAARDLFDYRLPELRLRYWREGERTAWVLDEIGKEQPITIGVVVEGGAIKQLRVLEFRESRGWEIRHSFFTDQFTDSHLTDKYVLSRKVDGITGATLSVNAARKVGRVALWLDREVNNDAAQTH